MKIKKASLQLLLLSLAGAPLLDGHAASGRIEEVIVRAKLLDRSVQEVGSSLTVFDAERFHELNGSDIGQLAGQSANVDAYGTNTIVQTLYIRGVGLNEFNGNFDAPVAVHVDEIYVSKPWMISHPFYDIERVEVLKGPQGTLFGRNTTGGALNYYTTPPTEDPGAQISLELDNHSRNKLEAHLNGPLGNDWAGRLSFYRGFGDGGPWDNSYTGDEVGEPDLTMARGQLQWDGDNTTVRLLVHGGKDKSETVPYKSPGLYLANAPVLCPQVFTGEFSRNPSTCSKFGGLTGDPSIEYEAEDTLDINQDYWPVADDSFYGGYLRVDHDFGPVIFTSLTSYDTYERDTREDSSADPIVATNTDWYNDIDQFSQEFRLGSSAGELEYLVGLFFARDELEEVDSGDLAENPFQITPPFATRMASQFEQEVTTAAVFFHTEYDLSPSISLVGGGRYSRDEIEIDAFTFLGANPPSGKEDYITPVIPIDRLVDDREDSDFSWELGVNWNPAESTLVYAGARTGFRSGGYSVPFGGTIVTFDPEEIVSFELGLKSQLLEDSLQFNAAAFAYEYDDLQVNVDDPASPVVPITRNIGKSETWGIESDLWWVPTAGLDLRLGMGYLDAEFTDTDRSITTYSGQVPLEGKRPVNTPEWNVHGSLRYERPFLGETTIVLSADFHWTDERYLEATGQPFDLAEDFTVVNGRLAIIAADGSWDISIWGRNVFDEEYLTYINNISFFRIDIYGEPATFGATLRYRLGGG